MRIQLPLPYPDELLYSVICRYQSRVGPVGDSALIQAVFGRMCRVQFDIPPFLDNVSQRTFELWRLTALELTLLHTLFPYYGYSSDLASLTGWLQSLPNVVGKRSHLGAEKTWNASVSRLQICPDCYAEDMTNYGESYWRRLHQLPGVLICPQHECFLQSSKASCHPHNSSRFADATTSVPIKCAGKATNRPSWKPAALQIARKSRDLLDKPVLIDFDIHRQYRALLESIGLCQPGKNGEEQCIDAITNRFGSELLGAMGIKPKANSMSWVRNITQCKPYLFHTLEHIVFQIFLETYVPNRKSLPSLSSNVIQWSDRPMRTLMSIP